MYVSINTLNQGEFFKKKEGAKATFERGEFDQSIKRFCNPNVEDMNKEAFTKSGTLVWVGFEY